MLSSANLIDEFYSSGAVKYALIKGLKAGKDENRRFACCTGYINKGINYGGDERMRPEQKLKKYLMGKTV